MYEISVNETPVKIWARAVDPHAWKEIMNLASLPFVFHHLAFMPDLHGGKGMPIGGVLATKDVIIPNAVGVDIGCGMCAVKTSWKVSGAYKDIDEVMANQQDLVRIVTELSPVAVIKGV